MVIRRPEVRNALSALTLRELDETLATLAGDAGVRGVVLTSFDGAIAGADIGELAALRDPATCESFSATGQAVLDRIAASRKPIVAALDGPVLGGGAELAMACHARVVGPQLVLGQPEVNLGIIPGYGGTQRLPRLVGVERAAELLRTGRTLSAPEACAWGWATGAPATDFVARGEGPPAPAPRREGEARSGRPRAAPAPREAAGRWSSATGRSRSTRSSST